MLIADIQHWVRRIQRTQADYPGIVGVRYLIVELSTAQRVDETGIRVALKRFFDGAAVERGELDLTFALRGLMHSTAQFLELARDQLKWFE
jgi:hypothetical protein